VGPLIRRKVRDGAKGKRTEDESVAVRGEVVGLDAMGRVVARHAHDSLAGRPIRNRSGAIRATRDPAEARSELTLEPMQRGWIKTKDSDYWRYELEREGAQYTASLPVRLR
jgi:hypothetical protein